uniref:FecR family protein n=1 Tax=Stenotrophomonas sp. GbtcB23 TaxID=2824768 RepID=UPI001C302E07
TAIGELQRIDLADGSVVTLGPDSAIAHTFTQEFRHIELLQGMAFFSVAPDKVRPFRVQAEGLIATVLGTAFDVNID